VVKVRIDYLLLVGFGGFCGAIARFGVNLVLGTGLLPWGTFVVNVSGSFLLGLVQVLAVKAMGLGERFRLAAGVGFCGAYTTFSTFTKESLELLFSDQILPALIYIFGTTGCCLLSVFAGMILGSLFCSFWEKRTVSGLRMPGGK